MSRATLVRFQFVTYDMMDHSLHLNPLAAPPHQLFDTHDHNKPSPHARSPIQSQWHQRRHEAICQANQVNDALLKLYHNEEQQTLTSVPTASAPS